MCWRHIEQHDCNLWHFWWTKKQGPKWSKKVHVSFWNSHQNGLCFTHDFEKKDYVLLLFCLVFWNLWVVSSFIKYLWSCIRSLQCVGVTQNSMITIYDIFKGKKNKVQNGPKRSKVHFEILTKMGYVLYSILKKKVFFDIILFGFLECVGCFMFSKILVQL